MMKKFVAGLSFAFAAMGCSGPVEEKPVAQVEQKAEVDFESCDGLNDSAAAFCSITQVANLASNVSTVAGAIKSGQQILQLIGAIPSPPDVGALLGELDVHLSRLGVSLGTQIGGLNRNAYVPDGISTAAQAWQLARLGIPVSMDSETYRISHRVVETALTDLSFQRVWGGSSETSEFWRPPPYGRPIRGPFAKNGDLVYDWRYGVPALMQMVAYRIAVLSSADPLWTTTNLHTLRHDEDMLKYRTALLQHLDRMQNGVKCVVTPFCGRDCGFTCGRVDGPPVIECRDVYSGLTAQYTGSSCGPEEFNQHPRIINELKHQIWQQMPLFAMRKMIDQLYKYARPSADLAQATQQIDLQIDTNLCLDVQYGNAAAGTPVWIWPCNGGDAQRWNYDRETGIVRNPALNKCLDVQWGNPNSGAQVWIWDCSAASVNNRAQRWSWDPESGQLFSALGPDIALVSSAQAGALAQTGLPSSNPEFNAGQRWHADPDFKVAAPSSCGKLLPGEGLVAGTSQEAVSSCDGRFRLVIQMDGNLVLYQNGVGALWATGTNGTQGRTLQMHPAGIAILWSAPGAALWTSHTSSAGAYLAVQDDGNVVIYNGSSPLWSSNTCCR